MLSQLMVTFGVFSLVLVLVYWINRAVRLFDQIIASGESATVFFELSVLTLPNVIKLVLPVAAFAASVYVTNRLSNESELVIVQSTGFSPWRLARPVLYFGLIVAAFATLLAHVLVPASLSRLADRQTEIAENVTAQLLVEGRFLHPSDGVTFYIARISPEGELFDVFLSDARQPERRVAYNAERALLVRDAGQTRLVMFNGMAQSVKRPVTEDLSVLRFERLTYDLTSFDEPGPARARKPSEMYLPRLLSITEEEARPRSLGEFRAEAHEALAAPLYVLALPLLAVAFVVSAGFRRQGFTGRILAAAVAGLGLRLSGLAAKSAVTGAAALWPIVYVPPVLGVLIALWMLSGLRWPTRRRAGAR